MHSGMLETMFVWVNRASFEQRPASVLLKFSRLRGAVRVLVFNRMYSGAVPGSFISRCVPRPCATGYLSTIHLLLGVACWGIWLLESYDHFQS